LKTRWRKKVEKKFSKSFDKTEKFVKIDITFVH